MVDCRRLISCSSRKTATLIAMMDLHDRRDAAEPAGSSRFATIILAVVDAHGGSALAERDRDL